MAIKVNSTPVTMPLKSGGRSTTLDFEIVVLLEESQSTGNTYSFECETKTELINLSAKVRNYCKNTLGRKVTTRTQGNTLYARVDNLI